MEYSPTTKPDANTPPTGWAKWWRLALDVLISIGFFATVPAYGVSGFILGVGFALSAADEWGRVRLGRFFVSLRDQARYALLALPFNAALLGAGIAWIVDMAEPSFWTVMGAVVAGLGAAAAHFTWTHPHSHMHPASRQDVSMDETPPADSSKSKEG